MNWKGNEGCNGGMVDHAFEYVIELTEYDYFLDVENCYPYRGVVRISLKNCYFNLIIYIFTISFRLILFASQ